MRIALLSPENVDLIAKELSAIVGVEVYAPLYGQAVNEALDTKSDLYLFAPDAVFIFYDTADVLGEMVVRPFGPNNTRPESALREIETIARSVRKQAPDCALMLNSIPAPSPSPLVGIELNYGFSLKDVVYSHNQKLRAFAGDLSGCSVFDYAEQVERHGTDNWYDSRIWYLARARLSRQATIQLASSLERAVAVSKRPRAKVIVVDLDNTMWGGVLGDDGPENIAIGAEGPGLAFRTFQQALLNFRDQGVLLAVASKNDIEPVMTVFRDHPDMQIRESDISAWQLHWNDKASSLSAIAEELDLGLDSFVFFDDNSFERQLIRSAHPDVCVIDVPDDPAYYVDALFACSKLQTTTLTDEDKMRAQQYSARVQRIEVSSSFDGLNDYLASLDMQVTIGDMDSSVLPRVAQLTQKTNQFNLTTRRYTEPQLESMLSSGAYVGYWLRLQDRFGDEGIVNIAIVKRGSGEWYLDTFLMSCRVIGRGVEHALVRHIVARAAGEGMTQLRAEYIATKRNNMVAELLPSLGFEADDDTWLLPANGPGPSGPVDIRVVVQDDA